MFTVTGTTAVSYRTGNHMIAELTSSLLLAAGLIFVSLAVIFRSLRLALAALIPNLLPFGAASTALYFTTGSIQYTAVMALTIGIALAVDDTIQFLSRFQRERRDGASVAAASQQALERVGAVLVVSSVIMLCGFASLLCCSLPPIRLFGAIASVLIFTALIGDALVLPAMVRLAVPEQAPAPAAEPRPVLEPLPGAVWAK